MIKNKILLTVGEIAEETKKSKRTVQRKVKAIKEEVKKGRYDVYSVAGDLINYYVYIDYLTFEKRLKDEKLRKYVPKFDLEKVKKMIQM